MMVVIYPQDNIPECDFCSSRPVTARYLADDFEITAIPVPKELGIGLGSKGGWAACAVCEQLIDAGNWDEVLGRAVQKFFEFHPEMMGLVPVEALMAEFSGMYSELREHNFHKGTL